MRDRAPIVISCAALLVAVLGATSPGQAAVRTVSGSIPAFAKTAGFATSAGTAQKLSGHAASTSGKPGTILVIGKTGKLPAAIVPGTGTGSAAAGATGPAGPQGATGAAGPGGISGFQIVTNVDSRPGVLGGVGGDGATCPAGKTVLGGGGEVTRVDGSGSGNTRVITNSWPAGDNGWSVSWYSSSGATDPGIKVTVYAICATVAT